jgi:hypothetical protein
MIKIIYLKIFIYIGDWGLGIGPNPQLHLKIKKDFISYF